MKSWIDWLRRHRLPGGGYWYIDAEAVSIAPEPPPKDFKEILRDAWEQADREADLWRNPKYPPRMRYDVTRRFLANPDDLESERAFRAQNGLPPPTSTGRVNTSDPNPSNQPRRG